ncbi:hypothetical protein QEZ54_03450 [Catellatospora sp. KI3]|uniref:hypothetical protein n=1 Tax=Catellatospora sp. KI3 TaxID=3041620 RepID=UPI0024828D96|nr:hypothetical protein [Catellatospora sp. KI3]MDI1460014.1 hypothetical protein [Catellatospora sp. KI3]
MTEERRRPPALRRLAQQVGSVAADQPVAWLRAWQAVVFVTALMLLWWLLLRLIGLGSTGSDFWRDLGTAPLVSGTIVMIMWARGRARHRVPAAIAGLGTLFSADIVAHAIVGRDHFGPEWLAITLGIALAGCYLFAAITHLPPRSTPGAPVTD